MSPIFFVRVEGLEPPCLAASDPKSDTSTNFATPAPVALLPDLVRCAPRCSGQSPVSQGLQK